MKRAGMSRVGIWAAVVLALPAGVAFSDAPQWPAKIDKITEVAVTRADKLRVVRTAALPADNPFADAWKAAPYVDVVMLAQQIAMPRLEKGSIEKLTVQALHDGKDIAFRVSWADDKPDGNVDTGKFSDGVAIELPLNPAAVPMMGQAGAPVQIIYWKALWQKDIDVGFQDVQSLHPNYWSDLYWFSEGKFPYPVQEAFKKPEARQWFIALSAGNPVAAISRTQPVQELIAAGWGSLTDQPESVSRGKGVWANGKWYVIIARPLTSSDKNDYQFAPGKAGMASFAVWQGSVGNAGGRKHWANWTPLEVDE